ncbi:MAG: LysR family transcriptional regulator [Maritimibacter sp.]
MDLDWDDLRVFLAVARGESLSAAGKTLKRDPATVGRRITRLEESIGTALFARSPQGYGVTEAGARLLAHAEDAEQAVTRGAEALAGTKGGLSGQIRIGAPDGCANYILPQVCAQIARQHPELELQVVSLPRLINLSKREADMVIAVSPPTTGRLVVKKITDYQLHLTAARRYLIEHPDIKSVSDLKNHPIIGYIPDMIFAKELDYLSEISVERVALASNSASVQIGFLRQSGGVGFAHDFALPFARNLRKVLPDEVALTRSFYLVRHASDARMERLTRVAELLSAGIRGEVNRLESLT